MVRGLNWVTGVVVFVAGWLGGFGVRAGGEGLSAKDEGGVHLK